MEQTYELTPEMLDDWAAQFSPNKRVATRCLSAACPVAQLYLDTFEDVDAVSADYDYIILKKEVDPDAYYEWNRFQTIAKIDTPIWASTFMRTVDKKGGKITAGTIRKTLQKVLDRSGIELGTNGATVVSI